MLTQLPVRPETYDSISLTYMLTLGHTPDTRTLALTERARTLPIQSHGAYGVAGDANPMLRARQWPTCLTGGLRESRKAKASHRPLWRRAARLAARRGGLNHCPTAWRPPADLQTRKDTVLAFLPTRHGSKAEAHHLWLARRLHGRNACPRHLPSVSDQRSDNGTVSRDARQPRARDPRPAWPVSVLSSL